jgi:hypothetical protein
MCCVCQSLTLQKYTYLFICQGVSKNFFLLIFNHLQNGVIFFRKISQKFRRISGFSAKNVRDGCATKIWRRGVSRSATATEKARHYMYYWIYNTLCDTLRLFASWSLWDHTIVGEPAFCAFCATKARFSPSKKALFAGPCWYLEGWEYRGGNCAELHENTRNLRENHQPPVHDVSLLHCIVADSVTVAR